LTRTRGKGTGKDLGEIMWTAKKVRARVRRKADRDENNTRK